MLWQTELRQLRQHAGKNINRQLDPQRHNLHITKNKNITQCGKINGRKSKKTLDIHHRIIQRESAETKTYSSQKHSSQKFS